LGSQGKIIEKNLNGNNNNNNKFESFADDSVAAQILKQVNGENEKKEEKVVSNSKTNSVNQKKEKFVPRQPSKSITPSPKPKSIHIDSPNLFPTKITKLHYGNATINQRIAKIALAKFGDYDATYIDEMQRKHAEADKVFNYSGENVNNAFFGWQQRRSDFVDLDVLPEIDDSHKPKELEKSSWPELDASVEVQELRKEIKSVCAEYMLEFLPEEYHQNLYSNVEVVDWISVLVPGAQLAFHDHPLATVSGTYYVQIPEKTPILFADPRGHAPYRYPMDMKRTREWAPTAPFHKFRAVDVQSGDLILFPPWLLHTVKPNLAGKTRVTFPFNCFFSGENNARLDSWFVTAGALLK